MRGAKCCMPPNNKCQRCGYLPQQSNANPTGLLKSNWHLSNVWDMWISIYLSIYLYTQTHTHTAQERSGKGGGAELSQWVGSCCLLFRFQHLVSRTLSLWLFHTATERASCFPLADPTSLTYPFLHFISRNYCQGVHKWLLHWAWFLTSAPNQFQSWCQLWLFSSDRSAVGVFAPADVSVSFIPTRRPSPLVSPYGLAVEGLRMKWKGACGSAGLSVLVRVDAYHAKTNDTVLKVSEWSKWEHVEV